MNLLALFCDGTGNYVFPPEPLPGQQVTLQFRTAADDVDSVCLLAGGREYEMEKRGTAGIFDFYAVTFTLGNENLRYSFRISSGTEVWYYNQFGVSRWRVEEYEFQLAPGFSTPDWAKGAVMYQIFVDRFCNGDPSNDVVDGEYAYIGEPTVQVKDWGKYPSAMDVRSFYGGDLKGVMEKLDYLQDLGVEVIYFNPLFVSPSNHKYDTQDYDYIDPHFGVILEDGGEPLAAGDTDNAHAAKYQKRVADKRNLEASNQLFIELVEELHRRGMKVILDGVFNHCGSFNKWMDRERIYENQAGYEKGAFVSADSPYRDFFEFFENRDECWPYNGSYDGWWGHDTLPKLNYEGSKELEEYILAIGRKWVSPPYNVDGWRLDVAADLGHSTEYNHEFWKKFRREVKKANPDALILAEHYGDPQEWMQGDEWDSVMNYDAFMEPVTWFLTGMEKHSEEDREELHGNTDSFLRSIFHHASRMLTPSQQVAMNELSNHDHSRFLTRTNHMVGRAKDLGPEKAEEYVSLPVMREAVAIQMTWVGAPTIYYGDEAGLCGFTDPDNRRTYPWGRENRELIAYHRELIRIHKNYEVFRTGSLQWLVKRENILAYGRFNDEDQFVIVVNHGSELAEVRVPVWVLGLPMDSRMRRVMYSYEEGYTTEYDEIHVIDGEIVVNMGSHSVLIAKNKEF